MGQQALCSPLLALHMSLVSQKDLVAKGIAGGANQTPRETLGPSAPWAGRGCGYSRARFRRRKGAARSRPESGGRDQAVRRSPQGRQVMGCPGKAAPVGGDGSVCKWEGALGREGPPVERVDEQRLGAVEGFAGRWQTR